MEKTKIVDAYLLLVDALPFDKRQELYKSPSPYTDEIMDLAKEFNCPLSWDECDGIFKMLRFPECFNNLPSDGVL